MCIAASWEPEEIRGPIVDSATIEESMAYLSVHDDPASLPRYSVSRHEAVFYYAGLPSRPKLVYRTGITPWEMPTGPEAYSVLSELRPVFGHKLNTVWNNLGPKIHDCLDSVGVLWTSIDVVRFIKVLKGAVVGPVVLWIGVAPETLSGKDAHTAAHGCLDLLKEFGITDVEIEYRESIYTRLAGLNLLKPVRDRHPTAPVRGPLTPVLGLFIAAQDTPHVGGTGGLYLAEGGGSKKILLITARHVLFPPNEAPNVNYVRTETNRPRKVLHLGNKAFNNLVKSIRTSVAHHAINAEMYNEEIEELQEREVGKDKDDAEEAMGEREKIQKLLDEANEAMEELFKFHEEVTTKWCRRSQRILGHIVRSPPITLGAGTEGFTEDYAIVELDSSKFKDAFRGNVIDLGTKISLPDFVRKMDPRWHTEAVKSFKYPLDRLLELRDVIQEDQMHNPDMLDHDGEPCRFVIKNGHTTGVTIGRANGIFSFVREYFNNGTHQTSMEWAILPYDHKSWGFSGPGDSGSIIADGHGRIGGLLTGGAGKTEDLDITYATPFFWLLPRIKDNGFPDAHLYPVVS